MAVDRCTYILSHVCFKQVWATAGEFHHFKTTDNFAFSIGFNFTVLAGNDGRQFVQVIFQKLTEFVHDARTLQR